VEHQLVKCERFENALKKYRDKYNEMGIVDFNEAIYTQGEFMGKFLTKALQKGCYI
jgi:hypothetical protein